MCVARGSDHGNSHNGNSLMESSSSFACVDRARTPNQHESIRLTKTFRRLQKLLQLVGVLTLLLSRLSHTVAVCSAPERSTSRAHDAQLADHKGRQVYRGRFGACRLQDDGAHGLGAQEAGGACAPRPWAAVAS